MYHLLNIRSKHEFEEKPKHCCLKSQKAFATFLAVPVKRDANIDTRKRAFSLMVEWCYLYDSIFSGICCYEIHNSLRTAVLRNTSKLNHRLSEITIELSKGENVGSFINARSCWRKEEKKKNVPRIPCKWIGAASTWKVRNSSAILVWPPSWEILYLKKRLWGRCRIKNLIS